MARNLVILLCVVASVVIVQVVDTASRNRPVLRGQLYIADCKDEGNTQEPYLPEKTTMVVLETLVLERVWVPSLVHPGVIKPCLPLTSRT